MASEGPNAEVWQSTNRRNLTKSMDTLFPQTSSDRCRVCDEQVVDGRWNYCSERCRDIAQGVQDMFIWKKVRERILERDEYTCQNCGIEKERWATAYWQIRYMINEDKGLHGKQLPDRCKIDAPYSGGFHVDHITPISEGGHPFDESNLQTLCRDCHREKTAEENRETEPQPDITLEDYMES